jgi:hypothetical protein
MAQFKSLLDLWREYIIEDIPDDVTNDDVLAFMAMFHRHVVAGNARSEVAFRRILDLLNELTSERDQEGR